jgi:IclR family acetate operon transcriptional repressor
VKTATRGNKYSLVGVDPRVAILDAFEAAGPLALVVIARAANLTEATTLRYVSSLVAHGRLERDDDSARYRLGLALFRLRDRALQTHDPRKIALPVVDALLAEFQETLNLGPSRKDELVVIEALESRRSIRKGATVDEPDHLHASAFGKSLLAALTADEARAVLERLPRHALTKRTITAMDGFLAELMKVGTRGYAVAKFAISISAPVNRLANRTMAGAGKAVAAAAAAISPELGYDWGAAA